MKRKCLVLCFSILIIGGIFSGCKSVDYPIVFVEKVEFETSVVNVARNETHVLKYTIFPEDASNQSVSFCVDDDNIISVSQDGVIIAKNNGNTKVRITTNDGNKTALCDVVVAPPDYSPYLNDYIEFIYPSDYIKEEDGNDAIFQHPTLCSSC